MTELIPKKIIRMPEGGPMFCYTHTCANCQHVTHLTLSMNGLAPSDFGGRVTVSETSMAKDAKIEFARTSEDDYKGADHD